MRTYDFLWSVWSIFCDRSFFNTEKVRCSTRVVWKRRKKNRVVRYHSTPWHCQVNNIWRIQNKKGDTQIMIQLFLNYTTCYWRYILVLLICYWYILIYHTCTSIYIFDTRTNRMKYKPILLWLVMASQVRSKCCHAKNRFK